MNVPANLKYTKEHEWVKVDGDVATIGVTEYAQGELGDIVFIELPDVGAEVKQMGRFGTIEAVKAVSDLFSPVSGKIVEIGKQLTDYDRIDCGVFCVTQRLLAKLAEVREEKGDCSLTEGVRLLAAEGRARVADIGKEPWQDVDTPADRAAAEAMLARS